MSAELQQTFLQLGICGAMLLVFFLVVMQWMKFQRTAESERLQAQRAAESERTSAIREGFAADVAAHNALVAAVNKMGNQFARVEGKLDQVLEITPVREMLAMHQQRHPDEKVMIDPDLQAEEDDTPVDKPPAPKPTPKPFERPITPARGLPYGFTKRPKTSGGGGGGT